MVNLDLPWEPLYTQSGGETNVPADSPFYYWGLAGAIVFTLVVHTFEAYLDARQRSAYKETEFPPELETTVKQIDDDRDKEVTTKKPSEKTEESEDSTATTDANKDAATKSGAPDLQKPLLPQLKEKFKSAQTYGLDKINFGMIAASYDVVESVLFLALGFLPFIWDYSVDFGHHFFGWTETDNEIKMSLIFLCLTTIIGTITSLPFELYSTFEIERKHGFNKQTLGLFFTDKIKSLVLTFVIGGPFLALLLHIIKIGGEYFYLYVWFFMFCFSVFMMSIVPVFIMPLFNKYEPLPDGELKKRIFELAASLKYPLTKLFVMDGSKRSSHSNAFMYGLGSNKRIVLFDTLMTQVHDDEILAILGHELGHWKLGHTLSNFVVTQIYFGAAFYFFSLCYTSRNLYAAFGFDDPDRAVPTIIALLLFFQTLWAPVDKVLSFVLTIFSRMNEFAADRFSADLGMSKNLISGLTKIHLENLGAMRPDGWYSTYHYSHPPLVERLSAMMAMDKKSN
ncbi:prenyl protease 1 homolog [Seminavis robusta]|uniref:Ste24 endopeptidase n=1 Tax=Seminavis robusta TaxID=568900 RepID=A0A9N8HQ47_9STRA|nr:prenyl protease 1 homolog [Seminavis robusta]|eukprot:Sro1157_g247410.1 prenyl protease 1 homolog (509) ;mRNA; f:24026-25648